jgi:homoserine dehydrogenase
MVDSFSRAGLADPAPTASMFAWAPVPDRFRHLGSLEFSKLLIEKADVAVRAGRRLRRARATGHVRIALVENEQRIRQAARCIGRFLPRLTKPCTTWRRSAHRLSGSHGQLDVRSMQQPLRLGIAGLGTVGASVVRLLERHGDALHRSSGGASRWSPSAPATGAPARAWYRRRTPGTRIPVSLARSNSIDVFVELIGGRRRSCAGKRQRRARAPARAWSRPTRRFWPRTGSSLRKLAELHGAPLAFEAAVGGGIPIIKTLREALAGNRLTRLFGILKRHLQLHPDADGGGNGLPAALREAQELGYAEADPSFDVEGLDTAHKLAILTSVAFGTEIDRDSIFVEGYLGDRAGGHRRGGRARLPHQASGRCATDR